MFDLWNPWKLRRQNELLEQSLDRQRELRRIVTQRAGADNLAYEQRIAVLQKENDGLVKTLARRDEQLENAEARPITYEDALLAVINRAIDFVGDTDRILACSSKTPDGRRFAVWVEEEGKPTLYERLAVRDRLIEQLLAIISSRVSNDGAIRASALAMDERITMKRAAQLLEEVKDCEARA